MMTEPVQDNTHPPMPTKEPKPGYKWSFVPSHMRNGAMTEPMWRQSLITKGPKKLKPKRGRPPHSERPRFTGQAHATHLRDQLQVPLTFLLTLQHMTQNKTPDVQNMMYECVEIIKEARLFIGRFTTNKPMEE